MWSWLGPVVVGVWAALLGFGGYAAVRKANVDDIIPSV